MNDVSFESWSSLATSPLDTVVNYILTGYTAKTAYPDDWLCPYIGTPEQSMVVLDFGCGVGRNSFHFALKHSRWSVLGYDNPGMLSKTTEYFKIHYPEKQLPINVVFTSDWTTVKQKHFDAICCIIVLQHIHEKALVNYINDFKQMTHNLVVSGRRLNDDMKQRSTWKILEESGLVPSVFKRGHMKIPYLADGDSEEHNTAVYHI